MFLDAAGLLVWAIMPHLMPEEVTANEAAGVKAKEDARASIDAYDRAEFEKELKNPETFRQALQTCEDLQRKTDWQVRREFAR